MSVRWLTSFARFQMKWRTKCNKTEYNHKIRDKKYNVIFQHCVGLRLKHGLTRNNNSRNINKNVIIIYLRCCPKKKTRTTRSLGRCRRYGLVCFVLFIFNISFLRRNIMSIKRLNNRMRAEEIKKLQSSSNNKIALQ